ncbi:hypothetical protein AXG93_2337s1040 [Marchantia polymorpha subsp. ruderalis]|uniref:Uncharacterized protein n=1 Tax=Marchantia polymorpha subsp. ruderalis TaxID=1480154 RepID=A0A176WL75_MARPO|nr:hypothetical protein AXG93_2337s1040 [Marchantia polymorpha subsp. ruderalis]
MGGQDKRKSSMGMRPKLWCTYCGGVGHVNIECKSGPQYHPAHAVEWMPTWESRDYYVENAENTYAIQAYAIQEGPPLTSILPAHILRYAPKEVATTMPQRRMVPPRAMVRFETPPGKDDVQVKKVDLSPEPKEEDNSWLDEDTLIGQVETRSAICKEKSSPEKEKREKRITSAKESKPKGSLAKKEELRPKAPESSAKRDKPLAKDLWSLVEEDSQSDESAVRILWRMYDPDIKDEVSGLLHEKLSKVVTPTVQEGVSAIPNPTQKGKRSS